MSLEHNGRFTYDGHVYQLWQVSSALAEHVEQTLGATPLYCMPILSRTLHHLACPTPPPCICHTVSVGPSGRPPRRSCYNLPTGHKARPYHHVPRAGRARCSSVDPELGPGPILGCWHYAAKSRKQWQWIMQPGQVHVHIGEKDFPPWQVRPL